jgi:hypothetical protein
MNSLCMMNKELLNMINQLFEIQKKVEKEGYSKIDRNLSRLTEEFENLGFSIINPKGESYDDRRADYAANIVGEKNKGFIISEVIKPIIYKKEGGSIILAQKGIVIAE